MSGIKFVLPYHVKFSSYYGGPVARWVYEVISRLDEQQSSRIEVLTTRASLKKSYKNKTVRIKYLFFPFTLLLKLNKLFGNKIETIISYLWCFIVLLNTRKGDSLIIENRLYYAIILRRFGFKGKIYVHLHNEHFLQSNFAYVQKINESVDGLFACSHAVLFPLKELNESLYNKSQVIYNGVDENVFFSKKSNYNKKESLLYVGRIVKQKGVHLLIEVYEKLLDDFPELQLNIVGSANFGGLEKLTDYELKIQSLVKKSKGEINFLGYKDHDLELPSLFNNSTITCMSTLYTEALGLVLIESLFCETIFVAPKLGGVEELNVPEKMLFRKRDPNDMYDKLKYLLLNPKERQKLVSIANHYAKLNFTWDKISNDFKDFIKTI